MMPKVFPDGEPAIVRGLWATVASAPVAVLLAYVSMPLRFLRLVVLRMLFLDIGRFRIERRVLPVEREGRAERGLRADFR